MFIHEGKNNELRILALVQMEMFFAFMDKFISDLEFIKNHNEMSEGIVRMIYEKLRCME